MEQTSTNLTTTGKKKIGVYATTMIGIAYAVTINNFTVGANLGLNTTFTKGIIAIVIAWVMLALVWTFSGLMGQISGRNAADIYRFVFGTKGYKIPSICISVSLWVWAIFDYWYVGSVMSNMLPNSPHLGFTLGIVIITACAIVGTIKDISSLKWLTGLTVPVAVVMFLIILVATLDKAGGMEAILAFRPAAEMPMVTAINALFSSFIACCGAFSDITCNCKSKKAVIIAMPISMAVVAFQFIVAQFGAIGMAAVDITSLALTLGGAVFYVSNVFVIFAQGNTVPSNTFIMASEFHASLHIPTRAIIFIQPIVTGALTFLVQYGAGITILNSWVSVISCMFGPMLAIIFAEFYIMRGTKLLDGADLPAFSKAGILSLAIGLILGVYLTYFCQIATPVGILTFVVAFLLHIVIRKGLRLS